jgi:hypothetical protein
VQHNLISTPVGVPDLRRKTAHISFQ